MTEVEILRQVYQSVVMLAGVVALWAVLTVVLHFQVRSLRRTVRALVAMRVTDGICGDRAQIAGGVPIACELTAGHRGWHQCIAPGNPPGIPTCWSSGEIAEQEKSR